MNCAAEFLRLLARYSKMPKLTEDGAYEWWVKLDTTGPGPDEALYKINTWITQRIFDPRYDKFMFSKRSQL